MFLYIVSVSQRLDISNWQKLRVVIDFRALNGATYHEVHPLPSITEILDQLGQCRLLSVVDLASVFYKTI